jgi:hypothetical protein
VGLLGHAGGEGEEVLHVRAVGGGVAEEGQQETQQHHRDLHPGDQVGEEWPYEAPGLVLGGRRTLVMTQQGSGCLTDSGGFCRDSTDGL